MLNFELFLPILNICLINLCGGNVLALKHGRPLALDVGRQIHYIISLHGALISHHHIEKGAEDPNARGGIIAPLVIEQCRQKVYQSGGKVTFLTDVLDLLSMWILG